jgi:hypothetical protein
MYIDIAEGNQLRTGRKPDALSPELSGASSLWCHREKGVLISPPYGVLFLPSSSGDARIPQDALPARSEKQLLDPAAAVQAGGIKINPGSASVICSPSSS